MKDLYSLNVPWVILNVPMYSQNVHLFFNVSNQIWSEHEQNYMANMIMNVSGTVFQIIHYFPSKQALAINLLRPALQSKQHMYIKLFDIISWSVWILILLAFRAITKYINKQNTAFIGDQIGRWG